MGGLNDIEVLETLDAYGFTIRAKTPWRAGDPDEWESYPLEIGELPDFSRNRIDDGSFSEIPNVEDPWGIVSQKIEDLASAVGPLPPPRSPDAMAWYLPFHYFGPDWGIYIKEASVLEIAGSIKSRLGGPLPTSDEAMQLTRASLSVLYLHEAFHHKVESFATRLEISRLDRVYLPYDDSVYQQLLGTDELLEEAFACKEMLTRFSNEKSFHGNIDSKIKRTTLALLRDWIPTLPAGYRRGIELLNQESCGELLSQIAEASPMPTQPGSDWDIANQMIRGLFHKNAVAHLIVPLEEDPIIPWFSANRFLSLSTRRVERHITQVFGYRDTGKGKGSHRHFHCKGREPITLPNNRESLSPGVQRQVAHSLGYRNIRDLAAHC
jgi:hypothetical protein